jgi:hypothetical protein
MRHKISATTLCLFFTAITFAQKITYQQWLAITAPPIAHKNLTIDCTPITVAGCNKITNNTFGAPGYNPADPNQAVDPFGLQLVTNWLPSHGTANIYDGVNILFAGTPPFAGAGFARMGVFNDPGGNKGEGIVQKIPALTTGRNYGLSFFLKMAQATTGNTNPVQKFYVVLMHCAGYNGAYSSDYITPPLPAASQVVYCETNLLTTSWKQVFNAFTPNSNYDMIWVYPETTGTPANNTANALFAYPELIDLAAPAFTAGPAPAPVYPNCTVTIGPATPNCGVKNAVFTWTGPSGQTIIAPASQQIQVDAGNPQNAGNWTLTMSVPGTVNTNNTCSQPVNVQASVVVPYCSSCATPAQILTSSYFDPQCTYVFQPVPIIPNQLNYYCVPWECGGRSYLKTNFSSGNQWYINDVPIIGQGGDIPGIGMVWITNNTQEISHGLSRSCNNLTPFKFQVKNTVNGCGVLSTPTYIFYGETLFPTEEMGSYKPNFTKRISTPFDYSYGPGAIYTWSIPGAIVTDVDPSTPEASVYFPANVPIPDVMGTLTVTNSPYCNGVYNLHFYYSINARISSNEPKTGISSKENNNFCKLYPNPATTQITIQSASLIQSVSIIGELNPQRKVVQVNGQKSITINLANLQPGIYNCQITTQNGIENQKLIIRR